MTAHVLVGLAMVMAAMTFFIVGATRDRIEELSSCIAVGAIFALLAILMMVIERDPDSSHREDDDDAA